MIQRDNNRILFKFINTHASNDFRLWGWREWASEREREAPEIGIRCPHMQCMNCRSYKTGNAIILGETCNRTATASQWMVIIHSFYRRQKVSFASEFLCQAAWAWVSTRMTRNKNNIALNVWNRARNDKGEKTRRIYVERQLRLRFVRTEERIAVELSTTVATVQSQHSKFMIIIIIDTVYAHTIYAQFDWCVTGDSCNYGRFSEYFCTYSP